MDEWWMLTLNAKKTVDIKKSKEAINDLHCRAIDRVWRDAVDWTNENMLP